MRRPQPNLVSMTASTTARAEGAVLGVDTATAETTVAVAAGGSVLVERAVGPAEDGRPRHAVALLAQIEQAAEECGGWERIETIAVGVGPGTFTGVRIGVATVRALAQGRGLSVAAVGSLAALARGIADGARGRDRLALIDARRGELFAGLYEASGQVLWEPFVATPEALCQRLGQRACPAVAGGDGSLRFRRSLEAAGVEVLPDSNPAHRMAARHVCALAVGAQAGAAELVKPVYLRRPDAEVWRERQAPNPQPPRLA